MGWLREMMSAAAPPFRSYDALADAALADPAWPADYRPQPRSLAAIFSKLDREVELDWLVERVDVQLSLATVLGRPIPDFRQAHGRGSKAEDGRHVRFTDVRFARALDLISEELCPGLPEAVLTPAKWGRLWWHAPSGAGRTLVGRWLSARGLARFVNAPSFHEALPVLPERGAVFVELEAWEPPDLTLARDGICIAAPYYPSDATGWQVVESPAPAEYLEPLLDWLGARLPGDGRFQQRAVFNWLSDAALREHIDTLGVVLGLCGLADEHGLAELTGKTFAQLGRAHFNATLSRASKAGSEDASWVRRLGYGALLGLGRALLTDTGASWDEPRVLDAWLELVPEEQQRGADLDWMKLSLALANSPLKARDLEKAARKVPPGAFRIIRTLQAVGLLRAHGAPDALRIEPRWLSRAVLHEARSGLVRLSPFEWGEALLRPSAAALVARSLHARMQNGDHRPIEDVLDSSFEDEHAAQVVALEAVFLMTGLVLLEGAELPSDQLESLWDEQIRLCVELPGSLPERRIEHISEREPLLARGTWCLAALAIAEQLPSARGLRHPLLRPWSASSPPPELPRLYDRVAEALRVAHDQSWAARALSLIDRLRSTIGSVEQTRGKPHVLELPSLFLDEIAHGVPAYDTWQALTEDELGLRALAQVAAARGIEWSRVVEAVFAGWQGAAYSAADAALFDEAASRALWPHASVGFLREWLPTASQAQRERVYGWLTDQQWSFVAELVQAEPFTEDAAWWAFAPAELVSGWLAAPDRALPVAAVARLWRRDAALALGAVEGALANRRFDRVVALIEEAPRERSGALLSTLRAHLDPGATPALALDALRAWLHARVAERGPEWPDAYVLLAACERALMPLRAQRAG
ncbi:MAG TPA: hypothetical protein VI072_09270 [Polyangiaceae bacterium]